MELDGEDWEVAVGQSFDRAVVEIHQRDVPVAIAGDAGVLDLIAVVLRGDRDAPVARVADGVVAAAVPKLELVRLGADGAGEELVAEADAEVGNAAIEHRADNVKTVVEVRRVSGSGRDDHAGRP
jgi:hypothetical protein